MKNLNLKLGLFAFLALSKTLCFGQMTLTEYKLGTMTLNSGAYAQDDDKRLGPLQRKEINTSDGQFRLTPDRVQRLSSTSDVVPLIDAVEIAKVFRKVYDIAAQEYIEAKEKAEKEDLLILSSEECLEKIEESHSIIEKYEPLKKMLKLKDQVKIYLLGDKNILIAGPASDCVQQKLSPKIMLLADLVDHKKRYQTAMDGASSEEERSLCHEELEKIEKNCKWAFKGLPKYYDTEAVKAYVAMDHASALKPYQDEYALKSLSGLKKQEFLLISLSKPIDELLRESNISNAPLSTHADMLFGFSPGVNHSANKNNNQKSDVSEESKVEEKKKGH